MPVVIANALKLRECNFFWVALKSMRKSLLPRLHRPAGPVLQLHTDQHNDPREPASQELREHFFQSRALQEIPTDTLLLVRLSLDSAAAEVLPTSRFVRPYVELIHEIDAELAGRDKSTHTDESPKCLSYLLIGEFNALTDGRLQQVNARYENLLEALSQIWEASMRPRYFEPSQRLQNLQNEAKRHPEDAGLQNRARELATGENDTATIHFDRDFQNARARLLAQRASEVTSYVRSRAKERCPRVREIVTKPGATRLKTNILHRALPQSIVRPPKSLMAGTPRTHCIQDAFLMLGGSQLSDSDAEHHTAVRETIDDGLGRQLFLRPGASERSSLLPEQSDDSFGVGSDGPGELSSGIRDEFRDEPPPLLLPMDDDESSGSLDEEARSPVLAVADHRGQQTVTSSGEDGDDEFEEDKEDRVRGADPSVGGEAETEWQEIDD
jgi:hypothetical protein